MRGLKNSSGRIDVSTSGKFTDEEAKNGSWKDAIPNDVWKEVVSKVNLSSEYPKGTQTVHRNITYTSYLNRIAEMIRIQSEGRFKTETEIFRIAVHIGMQFTYHIFCGNKKLSKNTSDAVFYTAIKNLEKKMKRAQTVAAIKEGLKDLREEIKNGNAVEDDINSTIKELFSALSDEDKKYVKENFFSVRKGDNPELDLKILNEINDI